MSKQTNSAIQASVTALRRCCNYFSSDRAPELHVEVIKLLASVRMTPRHVNYIYTAFRQLQAFDPPTITTAEDEVSTASCARLVVSHRVWVEKLMLLLLEIAGHRDAVNWDAFVYIFVQFCTLSKTELAQVLFFLVARQSKCWSINFLTNSQLEEYFDDYADCPVKSFNTSTIDFAKLPLAKYTMSDFMQLCFKYSQLINPVLHLQVSLQHALPSLRFWTDYDAIKPRNRKISTDYFMYRKVASIMDIIRDAQNAAVNQDEEHLMVHKKADRDALNHLDDKIPLPFAELPLRGFKEPEPPKLADWLERIVMANEHPLKGCALGSAAELTPRSAARAALPPVVPPRSVEEAIAAIKDTFGEELPEKVYRLATAQDLLMPDLGLHAKNAIEKQARNKRNAELDFIRKARVGQQRRDDFVTILERVTQLELIDRPVKKVQGHT